MSLQDSLTLGQCYREHGKGGFIREYQRARLPQTSQEVCCSTPTDQKLSMQFD